MSELFIYLRGIVTGLVLAYFVLVGFECWEAKKLAKKGKIEEATP